MLHKEFCCMPHSTNIQMSHKKWTGLRKKKSEYILSTKPYNSKIFIRSDGSNLEFKIVASRYLLHKYVLCSKTEKQDNSTHNINYVTYSILNQNQYSKSFSTSQKSQQNMIK